MCESSFIHLTRGALTHDKDEVHNFGERFHVREGFAIWAEPWLPSSVEQLRT